MYYFNKGPEIIKPLPKEKLRSTGTSIAAVPYKEGYLLLSDSRATNGSTYEYYATDKLVIYDHHIAAGAAGAAIGLDAVVSPFLDYFTNFLKRYHYDLEDIDNPHMFMALFNLAVQECNTYASQLYIQLLQMGKFIFVFRTKKFTFAASCNLFGDDILESNGSFSINQELAKANNYGGDICAIGSGGRYLLGGFLSLNSQKLLRARSKEEVIESAKKIYLNTTMKDLASDVKQYMEVIDIPTDSSKEITKTRYIL